jgi:hypothetical protein
MKMFGNLTTDGLEEATDVLGGGGLVDTGVYPATVKLAYAGKSTHSESQSVTVHLDINGREFRETFWVTNRNGDNSYADKKDPKKKHPLPGFTSVDDLCLVATGYGLADQTVEEKVVKLYDYDAKKELPQNVPVLTDLLGQEVLVAIVRQTVDKQKKNDAGEYVNTGETREENVAEKFFHAESRRTVAEIRNKIEEPIFIDKWAEKNTGKARNKAKGAEGNAGVPGSKSAPAPGANKPKTSLFGNK